MTHKSPDNEQRVAVFAGTFNPFTIGHADIVERGLAMFDRVIVCVGENVNKSASPVSERVVAISRIYAHEPRVSVESWDGLTVDFAKAHSATALLRGVRTVKDFEYERDMADANAHIGGIDTVLLFSRPEYAWISSSVVRELQAFGKDVSNLLPAD